MSPTIFSIPQINETSVTSVTSAMTAYEQCLKTRLYNPSSAFHHNTPENPHDNKNQNQYRPISDIINDAFLALNLLCILWCFLTAYCTLIISRNTRNSRNTSNSSNSRNSRNTCNSRNTSNTHSFFSSPGVLVSNHQTSRNYTLHRRLREFITIRDPVVLWILLYALSCLQFMGSVFGCGYGYGYVSGYGRKFWGGAGMDGGAGIGEMGRMGEIGGTGRMGGTGGTGGLGGVDGVDGRYSIYFHITCIVICFSFTVLWFPPEAVVEVPLTGGDIETAIATATAAAAESNERMERKERSQRSQRSQRREQMERRKLNHHYKFLLLTTTYSRGIDFTVSIITNHLLRYPHFLTTRLTKETATGTWKGKGEKECLETFIKEILPVRVDLVINVAVVLLLLLMVGLMGVVYEITGGIGGDYDDRGGGGGGGDDDDDDNREFRIERSGRRERIERSGRSGRSGRRGRRGRREISTNKPAYKNNDHEGENEKQYDKKAENQKSSQRLQYISRTLLIIICIGTSLTTFLLLWKLDYVCRYAELVGNMEGYQGYQGYRGVGWSKTAGREGRERMTGIDARRDGMEGTGIWLASTVSDILTWLVLTAMMTREISAEYF